MVDRLMTWLMRPRVRRVRRWSFVLTVPVAVLVGRTYGYENGALLLPARGRVDVWLELSEPVRVQRPMREPVFVRRLAVASDEPEALVDRLLRPAYGHSYDLSGLVAGLDLVALAREAA